MTCPVFNECLDYQEATGSIGFWAGEVISEKKNNIYGKREGQSDAGA